MKRFSTIISLVGTLCVTLGFSGSFAKEVAVKSANIVSRTLEPSYKRDIIMPQFGGPRSWNKREHVISPLGSRAAHVSHMGKRGSSDPHLPQPSLPRPPRSIYHRKLGRLYRDVEEWERPVMSERARVSRMGKRLYPSVEDYWTYRRYRDEAWADAGEKGYNLYPNMYDFDAPQRSSLYPNMYDFNLPERSFTKREVNTGKRRDSDPYLPRPSPPRPPRSMHFRYLGRFSRDVEKRKHPLMSERSRISRM